MKKSIWTKICHFVKKWLAGRGKHVNVEAKPPPLSHRDQDESVNSTQDDQPASPRRTVEPARVGGRRNKRSSPTHKEKKSAFIPKPELICRKPDGSRTWEIVLSTRDVPNVVAVLHEGKRLSSDDGEYRVPKFNGRLSVEHGKDCLEEFSLFDAAKPLIFKMQKQWTGNGRKISHATQGYFIVFAPNKWRRKGEVKVEPEQCKDAYFLAHHFHKDGSDTGDGIGGFEECDLLTQGGLVLCGTRLFDDSEEGELFGADPPRIKTAATIVWARVGEEGKELPGGWRGENFRPAERLLGDILGSRQGRFYIRVYNDECGLVDSGEFRYYANLREIRVNGKPYSRDTVLIPEPSGHPATKVEFIGAEERHIQPSADNVHAVVGPEGAVTIAPRPEGDKTIFSLNSEKGSVKVVIKLPRIWWQLEQDKEPSKAWRDTPLTMSREEFRMHAKANAVVKLCLPSHTKKVDVGFSRDPDRRLPVADGLRLNDFFDYEEIDKPLKKNAELYILCGEAAVAIIRITADPAPPPPDPRPATQPDPRLVPPTPKPRSAKQKRRRKVHWEALRALVRQGKGGGFRRGKGFSCGELQGAGLNKSDAVEFNVRIDVRRHSTHQINIDTLSQSNACKRRD